MALASVYTALSVAGIIVDVLLAPHASFAMPYEPLANEVAYVSRYGPSIRWGVFFQFGSAIPLGIFAAVTGSRLRFLGVRAAGETIAFCGGIAAMLMLMLSALAGWALSTADITDTAGAVRALQLLGFAAGGPGFVAPLGLFVAGVSVTSSLHRLIPRWLMWLGILIASASELSTLTLLTWNAAIFIPMGRFISIIWMFCVAATLPTTLPIHIVGARGPAISPGTAA
jgi:hypothetical protein